MSVDETPTSHQDGYATEQAYQQAQNGSAGQVHRWRAQEYLVGQALGITAAMGSVFFGRNLFPKSLASVEQGIQKHFSSFLKNCEPAYRKEIARKSTNYALMMGTGLATTVSTQISLARNRREKHDNANELNVNNDAARVMAGWGIGFFGATGSLYLAERWGRRVARSWDETGKLVEAANPYAVSDVLTATEKWLDKHIFNHIEMAPNNKFSDVLTSNLAMLPGGCPMSIIGQRIYENALDKHAYQHER